MAKILSGLPVKEKLRTQIIERISQLGRQPVLVIVQVGEREDSNIYIKNKIKFGGEVGVEVKLKKFPEEIFSAELEQEIMSLNNDAAIDSLIVQLPLPDQMDAKRILSLIKKEKDPEPATARAVLEILDYYNIRVEAKKVCIIGQGIIAGQPIADGLEKRGAQVLRCDINTHNIPEIARGSDILISAVGKPGLVTKEYVTSNQVMIDVGISTSPSTPLLVKERGSKMMGDVNFAEVEPLVEAITPVPGGVGPVTVACLFANLVDLVYNNGTHQSF